MSEGYIGRCGRYITSMMFGWCSSRRYLTSRTADISRPSLNWPTLIFFMAILRPVASSRPDVCVVRCQPDHVATQREKKKEITPIDDRISSLSNLLVFYPVCYARWELPQGVISGETHTISSVVLRWPSPLRP